MGDVHPFPLGASRDDLPDVWDDGEEAAFHRLMAISQDHLPDFWSETEETAFHELLAMSRRLWDSYAGAEAAFFVLEAAATLPTNASAARAAIEPLVRERLQVAEAEYAAGGAPAFEGVFDERCDREGHRRFMQRLVDRATKEALPRPRSEDEEWEAYLTGAARRRVRWHEGPPTNAQHAAAAEQTARLRTKWVADKVEAKMARLRAKWAAAMDPDAIPD
jgi:hypothetical protein